jgi:hypothetical protein
MGKSERCSTSALLLEVLPSRIVANHTTMPLLVKPLTGKPFEITLQTSETVDVLKARIQEAEGIPSGEKYRLTIRMP